MSRGGSAGGGSSQLGYLFGNDEAPKPAVAPAAPAACAPPAGKPAPPKPDVTKQVAAGVTSQTNNYHRADGQNTGNFLTVFWFPSFSHTNLFDTHLLLLAYCSYSHTFTFLAIMSYFVGCWAGEYHVKSIMEVCVPLSYDILVLAPH
uniref:Protein SPIRAL1-like 1 n=1 Tax=Setaria italica TaxID=4555 RepID=K4AGB6_SETIT